MDPPIENGISVNFGTMDFGMGIGAAQRKNKESEPSGHTQSTQRYIEEQVQEAEPEEIAEEEVVEKDQPTEKVLTQESEESIRIKQQQEAKKKAEEAAKKAKAEADRISQRKNAMPKRKKRKEQEAKKSEIGQP